MRYLFILLVSFALFTSYGKPNIILIMADDVGAYSMGLYGCDTNNTPNINSIATDGMRFENFFSYGSCAPSRASFASGRNPDLHGIKVPFGGGFPTSEFCIGTAIERVGYVTGAFEKWNLDVAGLSTNEWNEALSNRGFQTNVTFRGAALDDYGDPSSEETYLPYTFNQSACDFIRDNSGTNFFMWYSPSLCHDPFGPTPLDPDFVGTDTEYYYGMLEYLDLLVSNVLDTIESEGIEDNTVVIFTSDNGTPTEITNSFNGQLVVGGKQTSDDTANWVPFFIKWPNMIETNSVYSGITTIEDLFNTICEIGETDIPYDRYISGRSFYDQLLGSNIVHRRYYYHSSLSGGIPASSRNFNYKITEDDDLYDVDNMPLGDSLISQKDQLDIVNEIRLGDFLENTQSSYIDYRPWSGWTNEFILTNSL